MYWHVAKNNKHHVYICLSVHRSVRPSVCLCMSPSIRRPIFFVFVHTCLNEYVSQQCKVINYSVNANFLFLLFSNNWRCHLVIVDHWVSLVVCLFVRPSVRPSVCFSFGLFIIRFTCTRGHIVYSIDRPACRVDCSLKTATLNLYFVLLWLLSTFALFHCNWMYPVFLILLNTTKIILN